uniref:GAG-pre-integrase domain-containing protein n=1 Tax=Cannabis sativa TaxID=3483 RepID=A0A803QDW0_CANSA
MDRRFNMVSEHFPPLNANMATVGAAGVNNNGSSFNGAQTRSHSSAEPVYFNHSISIRLNDHNFLLWKQQVLAAIRGNRLLKFIKEPPPAEFLTEDDRAHNRVNQIFTDWEVQDQLLVLWLLSFMTESLLTRMVGCNTAQQIWTTLKKHFTLQNVDLLASVGETLRDRDHVAAIFKGLPSEYDTFVISTNTQVEEYTVGEIEAFLLASESRIEKSGKELDLSANIVTDDQDSMMEANLAWRRFKQQYGRGVGNFGNQFANQFGNRGNRGNEQGYMAGQGSGRGNFHLNRGGRSGVNLNNRVQCQLCLRFGHTAHDFFIDLIRTLQAHRQEPTIAAVEEVSHTTLLMGMHKNGLYTFDPSQIGTIYSSPIPTNSSQCTQPNQCETTSSLNSPINTSVATLDSHPKSKCTFVVTLNNASVVISDCFRCNTSVQNNFTLWHNRLGHPSEKVVQTVLRSCNIPSVNKDSQFSICSACCLGKIHKFPFPKVSSTIISEPLKLVVSDLWGPSHTPSFNGYKYYIHFVDAYSRFTWLYLLKNKSDALKTFQHFKSEAELQLGKSIKTLQTDWGVDIDHNALFDSPTSPNTHCDDHTNDCSLEIPASVIAGDTTHTCIPHVSAIDLHQQSVEHTAATELHQQPAEHTDCAQSSSPQLRNSPATDSRPPPACSSPAALPLLAGCLN